MEVCVAQTKPIAGNIQRNIHRHKTLIEIAASQGAVMIIFPELSLTGYEPKLAKQLAAYEDDSRFDEFQEISDLRKITVGIGMPIKKESGVLIGMIFFQPGQSRQTYCKQYLHSDLTPIEKM